MKNVMKLWKKAPKTKWPLLMQGLGMARRGVGTVAATKVLGVSALALALGGIGIGAGLMYFLSPSKGARRRAALRDKAARVGHTVSEIKGRDIVEGAQNLFGKERSTNGQLQGQQQRS